MTHPLASLCLALLVTSTATAQETSTRIRLERGESTSAVVVDGLSPGDIERLTDPKRAAIALTVRVDKVEGPSMLGKVRVQGKTLRFEPRFPMEPGLTYRAVYRPEGSAPIEQMLSLPEAPARPPTRVVRVAPSSDELPENLLKLYIHFSSPMARGESYAHVDILDEAGKPLVLPFLEIGEELWDPSGTRLTLLFDPGRIKRGLLPREQDGPILTAGQTYTFRIRETWPDANGKPLAEGFLKPFRAIVADDVAPTIAHWKLNSPSVASRASMSIDFPEPLDDALLRSAFRVVAPDGRTVAGAIEVERGERRWVFRPEKPWIDGEYAVIVEAILEDRCGNNLLGPFEVDVTHPATEIGHSKTFQLPFRPSNGPGR